MSRKKVAEFLGITPRTVYNYEKQKKLSPDLFIQGKPRYIIDNVVTQLQTKKK